jgi:asparagine synthase (glutamine-hydrolysing)
MGGIIRGSMCGIWAYLKGKQEETSYDLSAQYADFSQLTHRGPDHSHFEHIASAGLTLGFHRLAIVNTSMSGNQPFKKEESTRTVILLCNGEIYNYKEVAEELCLPSATNDCYTLLELYLRSTHPVFHSAHQDFATVVRHRVKGEFAFVLFELDHLKRVTNVIAGRDSIGVRPLYVSSSASSLLFTSEIKGALQYQEALQEFPPGEVWEYHVTLAGISLPQRTCLTKALYHDPSPVSPVTDSLAETLLIRVRDATVNSVKRRLAADRPLAFLLSGGVDSSLVAAVSAKLLGKPIRTFCCTLSEQGQPVGRDVEYAREVAAWLQSDHTEVLFTKEEALAAIPDVIRTIESWDTTTVRASVGQYLVCRWIGQNTDCKVVLVGEGPDEVCSSYLFNWYAPSPEALDQCAKEYVKKIHLYDGRRADRCIARWGLEARVPFLDPEFIQAYWSIPARERMPVAKGLEKWWLREAFKGLGVLPERVRLRMKDAFSDSISGQVSWTQIIQEWVQDKVTDEELQEAATHFSSPAVSLLPVPQTKEAYYYRKVFCEVFGERRQSILPAYWQPRWNKDGQEVTQYVDPSARTLGVYHVLNGTH